MHAPAQLIRAARFNIPAILLIRHPADAVVSRSLSFSDKKLTQHLLDYVLFYRPLLRWKSSFVTAQFTHVVQNYDRVIRKVNVKFSTTFDFFHHTRENEQMVFRIINAPDDNDRTYESDTSVPTKDREEKKKQLHQKLTRYRSHPYYRQAMMLFRAYC